MCRLVFVRCLFCGIMSVEDSNREMGLKLLCGAAVVVASTAGLFIGAADKSVSSADLRTLHRWLLDRGCGPLMHAGLRVYVPAAPPRWFAAGQGKRWTEVCFCWLSALWVAWFGVIVATGAYEWFEEMSYMVVGLAMALPYVVVPLLIPGQVAAACARAPRFVGQTWLTRLAWWLGLFAGRARCAPAPPHVGQGTHHTCCIGVWLSIKARR